MCKMSIWTNFLFNYVALYSDKHHGYETCERKCVSSTHFRQTAY